MPTTLEAKTPRLVTALPGPNAKRVLEQDAKFMSPSYTRDYPLVAKRGHGGQVYHFHQFRYGGDRRRHPTGGIRHKARQFHRVLRLLSWPVHGRTFVGGVEIDTAQGIRRVAQWNRAHPVSVRLSLPPR